MQRNGKLRCQYQGKTIVSVKVVYSKSEGSGLRDAYRLLAKKMLEERGKCTLQYMSE